MDFNSGKGRKSGREKEEEGMSEWKKIEERSEEKEGREEGGREKSVD